MVKLKHVRASSSLNAKLNISRLSYKTKGYDFRSPFLLNQNKKNIIFMISIDFLKKYGKNYKKTKT